MNASITQLRSPRELSPRLPAIRFAKPEPAAPMLTLPRVSFIIPTLNEAKNLPHLLPRIPTWAHGGDHR